MKTFRWIAIAIIVLVVVGTVSILMNVPMAASLQITPSPVFATFTPVPERFSVQTLPTATPVPSLSVQVTPSGTCGQTGAMTILLLGESSPQTKPPRGVDAIRVVKIDFDGKTIRILSFPPDLWVTTPELTSQNGILSTSLTQTYYQAKILTSGDERQKTISATSLFAQTLANNFGVIPDHYVTLKQDAVKQFVDALGGLYVNIPTDLDSGVAGLTKFKAGYQLLTGQEVLDYVRIAEVTKGNDTIHGEYARLARQDQVIMLLFTQMSRPETLLRLPALANTFYGQVVTDLSMSQMLDLACVFKDSSFSLRYLQIGPELVSRNEQSLVPKPDAVDAFLKENFLP